MLAGKCSPPTLMKIPFRKVFRKKFSPRQPRSSKPEINTFCEINSGSRRFGFRDALSLRSDAISSIEILSVPELIQEFKDVGAHVVDPKHVTNSAVSLRGAPMVEVPPNFETWNPDPKHPLRKVFRKRFLPTEAEKLQTRNPNRNMFGFRDALSLRSDIIS